MEQVRIALEVLKKYHFWILCGLIVLIALGTWYVATADRADAFTKAKTRIDGVIRSTQAIASTPNHPSDALNKAILVREGSDVTGASEEAIRLSGLKSGTDSLCYNVASASKRLFEDQQNSNPLPVVWPNSPIDQARFKEEFDRVWNHKIEDIEKPPADAKRDDYELDKTYRNQYRDRILEFFPTLFDLIDVRREATPSTENPTDSDPRSGRSILGGAAQPGDNQKRMVGVVTWRDAQTVRDHFRNWNDIPTTLDVRLAQEDLWVYEALLRVVRNTNNLGSDPKDYKAPPSQKDARIKEILALEIGSQAADAWAKSENSVFVASEGGGTAATAGGAAAPAATAGHSVAGFQSTGAAAASGVSQLAGRYVDNNGKLLTDLSQDTNHEFRMMPIDLQVVIEQKDIPRLLVECANSSMRIDVRSVRVLADKPPAFDPSGSSVPTDAGGAGAAGQGGMSSGRGGHEDMGHMGFGARTGQLDAESGDVSDMSMNASYPPVPVEIQGIIYIYNPPTTPPAKTEGQASAVPDAPSAAPATTPPTNVPRR